MIYLRHVERAKPHMSRPEDERIYPPPHFIVPLSDITQVENGRIHFEARIEPVGDPSMRVDWFHNGRLLPASKSYFFLTFITVALVLQEYRLTE